MTAGSLVLKNLFRNKLRTTSTVTAVLLATMAFVLLRTILSSWTAASEFAAKDRVSTRHKTTYIMTVPKRYVDEIRQIPGVKASTFATWFGGRLPAPEAGFFVNLAVEARSALEVWDELVLPSAEKEQWLQDRQGAIVGQVLARKMGWKVGDKVVLQGTIYPGDWELRIAGIYRVSRKSLDESTLFFHWEYMNEALSGSRRDQIGWTSSRIDDPAKSAAIAAEIDRRFDASDIQTLSLSERAMQLSFLATVSAVLQVIDLVSLVVLLIMILILGNAIALSVQERTTEYGVLRAVGFMPRHLAGFILGEAGALGLTGGIIGVSLGYLLVERVVGRFMEENMGGYFPYFHISAPTLLMAPLLAAALAIAAAVVPAYRVSKTHVVDALGRIG